MIWDWISWEEGSSIGYSVQQTTDGQYIITGEKLSSDTIGNDVLLIKIDVDGNKVWERTFDRKINKALNFDAGRSVQQTSDGGYIITGYTDAIFANDVLLIKTNSEGYKVWDRTFGGIGDQFGSSVQQTTDGGYIITGRTGIFRAKDPYSSYYLYDVWLIKTNRFGIKLWDRTFGGTEVDWGSSVQQTTDGGYIITGSVLTPVSNQQMLLIKTNSHGRSKPISSGNLWFEQLFQRFPNGFPLLRQLFGYQEV